MQNSPLPVLTTRNGRREQSVAALLLLVLGIGLLWKIAAERSTRAFDPFSMTAADFVAFNPSSPAWHAQRVSIPATPIEPNLMAFRMQPQPIADPYPPVFVRLAHGYNMPDCMRIKYYRVELIADRHRDAFGRVQVWSLTDRLGDVTLWVTSLLDGEDFSVEDKDVRSLPFPRIGIPDDPGWAPQGLTWRSFRHPIRNLRWYFRARWNNARGDWLTFFRLKRPAWASEESKTLVSTLSGRVVFDTANQDVIIDKILAAHHQVQSALEAWAKKE